MAQRPSASSQWILLGTGSGEGIYRARWNSATGEIGTPELAVATFKPTYLAKHPSLPVVYACNEGAGAQGQMTAFGVTDKAGAPVLQSLGSQSSYGDSPCFAALNGTGGLLFAANYTSGSLVAYQVSPRDGALGASDLFSCAQSKVCGPLGPVKDRQDVPHLHCATMSPDGRFVLACDLGDDAILVFPLQEGTKPLGPPVRVATRPGSGPRHLAFHPNGRWMYCISELDCTVELWTWGSGGEPQLRPVAESVVSIRAPHAPAKPKSTGAEIAITKDGRFLYTSTRYVDVLNVFRIDGSSGKLIAVQQLPCGGKVPRHFALDATERWLVCTNQDSDSVTVFARGASDGRLTPRSTQRSPNAMCVVWV